MKRVYFALLLSLIVVSVVVASIMRNAVTSASRVQPISATQTTGRIRCATAPVSSTKARQVQQAMATNPEATAPPVPSTSLWSFM